MQRSVLTARQGFLRQGAGNRIAHANLNSYGAPNCNPTSYSYTQAASDTAASPPDTAAALKWRSGNRN
jgi:hypothetical protein